MGGQRPVRVLLYLFVLMGCFSGNGYSHTAIDNIETHQYEDQFLAAQARKKDMLNKGELLGNSRMISQNNEISLALAAQPSAAAANNFAQYGQWGAVKTWPFAFASAANLPDGRILAWGGNAPTTFSGGTYTYAGIWNPVTDQITSANHTSHSLFCGIPVMLEDGKVFVAGGDNGNASSVKGTSTFNYQTQKWTRIQDMAVGRWYNGAVALPNGQVFTAIGEPGSAYPEIWTAATGWSYLNGASLQTGILDYPTVTEPRNWLPHLHLAPNGKIFHSGHTPQMHYIDPTGNGLVTPVPLVNDWNTANTPGVLFAEGKLLQAGGALYSNSTNTTKAAVIDLNGGLPTRNIVNNMQFPRIFHNEVVLPNGEVMVIGGNSGEKFSDVGSQYTPEIWNPLTQTWRPMANHQVPRNYHSVALLMADGRVWSGGGGLCGCSADHPDSQVFSPPYLFNGDGTLAIRPEISDAPNLVSYGRTINVLASPDIQKFSMVKMSSTTHALNSDMRFLDVPFIEIGNGNYQLNLHTNRNVMTPGYWMLFALNGEGVPSIAKIMQVSTSGAPVINNPGDQESAVNVQVSLTIPASDPNGDQLVFNAVGLPQGLAIDSRSGQISGTPQSSGNSRVVVSASDGVNIVTTSFIWNIGGQVAPPVSSGVFGGTGGSAFADTVAANQQLAGIKVRAGWWLDAIQGITNTGVLPQHGGNGGNLVNVTWPATEYLTRVYGVYGNYIGQISFVTNTGRVLGPYGTGQGGMNVASFDHTVPAGKEIVGFSGRASAYLDAIGVMYRSRQATNQPPIVQVVADQVQQAGTVVDLQITASDPDNDALTFSATGLPTGLSIASATGKITGAPSVAGEYDVVINVQDARGASSGLNFKWSIYARALVINPITTAPQAVNTVVNLTASVAGGINTRYKWSFGDNSPETAYASSPAITHIFTQPGLYVVRLTVMDDRGVESTKTFIQAIHAAKTAIQAVSSSNMVVSNNSVGRRLWVVNQDNDTVSVFNTDTDAKLAEIAVDKAPRTIAVAPDGRVWVANKGAATLSVINPVSLQVQQTINLPYASQPFGLAFAPNGNAAYVVLEATGQLLKLNPSTGVQIASADIGSNPRHLSISGDSGKILVSRFITRALPGESTASVLTTENNLNRGGEVLVVNANTMAVMNTVVLKHSDKEDTETQGAGLPNYLAMPVIAPDGLNAWVPSKQDNIKRGMLRNGKSLTFQNSVRAIGSKIDLGTLSENYASRIDFDNSGLASAALFDISGNYLFVALETSRELVVVDAYGGRELSRIQVGRAPQGMALSSDGKKLYVNNFMERSVSVIDLTDVLSRGDWQAPVIRQLASVASEKLSSTALAGKQLFYDAKDTRLARDAYLSCASCHSEGGHDGRVWDLTGFGEGLRNTIDLRGRAGVGHGLLHWSANFDEIQDFEGQIRNLAGGSGLMTDTDFNATQNTLGTPKAGKSVDLDALAAYVSSLKTFAPSPYRNSDGSLTDAAIAGKTVFNNNCVQCHGGAGFTDSPSGLLHDVGTIKPSSGKRLNNTLTGLDSPTLRDVWNTGPYLHDGSAATLTDAVRAHNSLALSDGAIKQVVAYIQQIADTEAAAPPPSAINGTNGDDILDGTSGNDIINGFAGNDLLLPGGGIDIMNGGPGDDFYDVDDTNDQVVEALNEGYDFVHTIVSYQLSPNVETLEMDGTGNISGTGNDTDNILFGNTGNNTLTAGKGNDFMMGNAGNDTYVFNVGDGQDYINNIDIPSATDTVRFGAGIAEADILAFHWGPNLVLQIRNTNDQVTIDNYYGTDGDYKIDRVEFANGQSWNQTQIQSAVDNTN